mgnify:CR=1 FL=1|jgi:predicted enzyme related to lactoylglutathione lyase
MLGLRTVIFKVPDLEKAKQWYMDAFQAKPYFDEVFYIGFDIGGYELGLVPENIPKSKKSSNVVAYWGVEDINKSYQDLIKMGATPDEEPTNVGGELMVASVLDPWDNCIGIIYNPYFKLADKNN